MLTLRTSQSLIVPPEKQLLQMPAVAASFSSEAADSISDLCTETVNSRLEVAV